MGINFEFYNLFERIVRLDHYWFTLRKIRMGLKINAIMKIPMIIKKTISSFDNNMFIPNALFESWVN
jgi:hypothetical protein